MFCFKEKLKIIFIAFLSILILTPYSFAGHDHKKEHGGEIFHNFDLEIASGKAKSNNVKMVDFEGWIGNDDYKFWLKNEFESEAKKTKENELWLLFSKKIDDFWDFQTGVKKDINPHSLNYFTLGFSGLAPYFIESEFYLLIDKNGAIIMRFKNEKDFLITQKMITKAYIEGNFATKNIKNDEIGKGLVDSKIGLQTRYEISRKFAPFIDLRYEKKYANTAKIANKNEEDTNSFSFNLGLKFIF